MAFLIKFIIWASLILIILAITLNASEKDKARKAIKKDYTAAPKTEALYWKMIRNKENRALVLKKLEKDFKYILGSDWQAKVNNILDKLSETPLKDRMCQGACSDFYAGAIVLYLLSLDGMMSYFVEKGGHFYDRKDKIPEWSTGVFTTVEERKRVTECVKKNIINSTRPRRHTDPALIKRINKIINKM